MSPVPPRILVLALSVMSIHLTRAPVAYGLPFPDSTSPRQGMRKGALSSLLHVALRRVHTRPGMQRAKSLSQIKLVSYLLHCAFKRCRVLSHQAREHHKIRFPSKDLTG